MRAHFSIALIGVTLLCGCSIVLSEVERTAANRAAEEARKPAAPPEQPATVEAKAPAAAPAADDAAPPPNAQGHANKGGGSLPHNIITSYTKMTLALGFNGGAFVLQDQPFVAGEYVRWNIGDGKPAVILVERARLHDDANKNQWWKIKATFPGTPDPILLELLLPPDHSKALRIFAKYPGEPARDVDIAEYGALVAPFKLDHKALQAAKMAPESVTVPAGTFAAKRYTLAHNGRGHVDIWAVDKVPGGFVKQMMFGDGDRQVSTHELVAHGKDAASELNPPPKP